MARIISATLVWDGPYEQATGVIGKAGIYMVIAGWKGSDGNYNPSTYILLDIGQSGEAADRLASHDREDCWERNKPTGSTLLFKFAAMPSSQFDETDRRIVECCLRFHNRPLPCGTECNQAYDRPDSVSIANKGQLKPLSESYTCRPG